MSSSHEAQAVVRRIYEAGFNQGNDTAFDECYTPDFVHHSKVIHDVALGDADRVAARLRIHGHALQPYGTVAAGPYDVHAVAWFRIVWGSSGPQVAEEWLFVDAAA